MRISDWSSDVCSSDLEDLIEGIEIEGIRYGKIDANLERRTGRNQWIEMTLTEGKNREVRRVLEHLDLKVSRLIRTRYGPFLLDDLPAGGVEEIRRSEEHTSELQSLMRISYAVFCLNKKNNYTNIR